MNGDFHPRVSLVDQVGLVNCATAPRPAISWRCRTVPARLAISPALHHPSPAHTLDVRGRACPIPVARSAQAIVRVPTGEVLEVLATDPDADLDMRAWASREGHEVVSLENDAGVLRVRIRRGT